MARLLASLACALIIALPALADDQDTPDALPAGPYRDEVFYRCVACHSTAVILRTRLSRERWDELMDWMTAKHDMPVLEGEERRQVVDYLAAAFPPAAKSARGKNPFAED